MEIVKIGNVGNKPIELYAGEHIEMGDIIYINKEDGKLYKCTKDTDNTIVFRANY